MISSWRGGRPGWVDGFARGGTHDQSSGMASSEQVLVRFVLAVSLALEELLHDFPSAGMPLLVKSPQPLIVHRPLFLFTLAMISTTVFFLPSACQASC